MGSLQTSGNPGGTEQTALLSVLTFFLPAVHSSFISYLYVFVYCVVCSSSLFSFLLVNLLLL